MASQHVERPAAPAATPSATFGVFDAHHPPSADLIADCVHCGFCLTTCPTYVLWGEEMDSPRGRIYLMDLGLKNEVEMTSTYVGHFDKCLGCMACVTACPSGVQYEKLIEATRSQIERRHHRPATDRLFRRMLFEMFPHPQRLRVLAMPLWLYQASGLRRLVHAAGLPCVFPARLRAMEGLLPPVTLQSLRSTMPVPAPAGGRPRMRVGLLLGCVQRVFFPGANEATARVLAAEGCEVVVPADQGCCGALMVHAGQEADAVLFAKRMIDAFETAEVDRIVINAAGCGSSMKEYGHLLRDDPVYALKAAAFAARCRDVTELLVELGEPHATRHPVTVRVAYHDACHLRHAQRVADEPRQLLAGVPGLELLEIEESAICCGSAGIYNLLEPQAANELGDRKATNILATGAEAIVTGNPGCLLQIRSALERLGRPLPVLHTVELIDASIRGVMPDSFLSEPRPSGSG
ncbi:MAG: heterodisulfide reductase-related iron-sulfur binding cluster [Planctomycetaceae bacterium]